MSVVAAPGPYVHCGEEISVIATATSAAGRPVSGLLLNFNVLEGGGGTFGGSALTNRQGVARDYWTVGDVANRPQTPAVRAVDPITGNKNTYFSQTVTTLSRIAFVSRYGSYSAIWVMNTDGTDRRVVTDGTAPIHEDPAWSPDGRKIAFSSNPGSRLSIWIINADGTGLTRLIDAAGGDLPPGETPAWSPDGKQIAFSGYGGTVGAIYVVNLDGTGLRHLTDDVAHDYGPAWSPDGRQIAFYSIRGGTSYSIWVMNVDGTGLRRLTERRWDYLPKWSPDGRQIVFMSRSVQTGFGAIAVMNADGTGRRLLTDDAEDHGPPTWSPDGRKISFSVQSQTYPYPRFIRVMNADGSDPRDVTDKTADDHRPVWSGCIPR